MSEAVPEMISLGAKLAQHAATHGDKPAITCGAETLTYAELHRRSNRMARGLAEKGVRFGDLVTIGLPNSVDFATAAYAAWKLGATPQPVSFRLPKAELSGERLRGAVDSGRMAVLIDRRTYWQVAFLIPKGAAEKVKARGIGWLRGEMQALFPELDLSGGLGSEDDLHLLSVALDRLDRWHRPGLLAIGDAAHAMSPIGGIGINLAIQDAVAAANVLAGPLARGEPPDALLPLVQKRREFPTRVIQVGQKAAQDNVIGTVLSGRPITGAPLPVRLLNRYPILRRIPGRIIGLGVRRERVRSPAA